MGIFKSHVLQLKNTCDKCKVCALMLSMTKTKERYGYDDCILLWRKRLYIAMIVIFSFTNDCY